MKGQFGWILLLTSLVLAGCQTGPQSKSSAEIEKELQQRLVAAADTHLRLGYAYVQTGQIERGKDRFLRALNYAPQLPQVHVGMGYYFSYVGQNELAEDHYIKALQLDPNNSETLNSFGVHLCNVGRYAQAQLNFSKALSNQFYSTPARTYINAGLCRVKEGNSDQAVDDFRNALKTEPENKRALSALAQIYLDQDKLNLAGHFLDRYARVSSVSPGLLFLQFKLATAEGDKKQAVKLSKQLQSQFPQADETFQMLEYLDRRAQ